MKTAPDTPATLQARLDALVSEMLQRGIRMEEAAREFERRYLQKALERCEGSKTEAARLLGLHRNTLASRLANHAPPAARRRGARRRPRPRPRPRR